LARSPRHYPDKRCAPAGFFPSLESPCRYCLSFPELPTGVEPFFFFFFWCRGSVLLSFNTHRSTCGLFLIFVPYHMNLNLYNSPRFYHLCNYTSWSVLSPFFGGLGLSLLRDIPFDFLFLCPFFLRSMNPLPRVVNSFDELFCP